MEEAKTIKVSPRVYAELNAFTGLLSERLKKRVSIDDAFLYNPFLNFNLEEWSKNNVYTHSG